MKLTINIDAALSFSSQKDLIRHAIAEFLQFDDEIIRSDYAKVGTTFGSVELINPDYSETATHTNINDVLSVLAYVEESHIKEALKWLNHTSTAQTKQRNFAKKCFEKQLAK